MALELLALFSYYPAYYPFLHFSSPPCEHEEYDVQAGGISWGNSVYIPLPQY